MSALPAKPLVSVLMSNYNYAQFIGDAIESVLEQSYSYIELVVCDDGSTDDSVRIIRRYADRDRRVTLVSKANGGMASALNAAYSRSQGSIICFLDSDDLFAPGKLDVVLAAWATSSNAGMLCHPLVRIVNGETRHGLVPEFGRLERGWIAHSVHSRGGRWVSPTTSGISLHRTLAQLVFPIPEQRFPFTADWFIYTLGPLLAITATADAPLGFYRIHGSNIWASQHWDAPVVNHATLSNDIRDLHSWIGAVNERLTELGYPERRLTPSQNLYVAERLLMLEMVQPSTRRLALTRSWMRVARRIAADDVSDKPRRLLMPIALASAILLPRTVRGRLLSAVVGRSRLKSAIRSMHRLGPRKG
jgi:Glycosyl transferase family 2